MRRSSRDVLEYSQETEALTWRGALAAQPAIDLFRALSGWVARSPRREPRYPSARVGRRACGQADDVGDLRRNFEGERDSERVEAASGVGGCSSLAKPFRSDS